MKNCELQELSRAAGDRPIAAFSSETAGRCTRCRKAEPCPEAHHQTPRSRDPGQDPYDLAV